MGKIIPFGRFGGAAPAGGDDHAGMSEECKSIADFLGCAFEYFGNAMGRVIYDRYEALAVQGRGEGFAPLVILPTDTLAETFGLEFLNKIYDTGTTPEALAAWREQAIAEAAQADAVAFFREAQEELQAQYGEELMPEQGRFRPARPCHEKPLRNWAQPMEALIAKLPTRNPWEAALWAPTGGFNDCPVPVDMAAAFRHWQEKYGAVPVVLMGHDTWFLRLDRPPQSDEDCEALAKEHFAFCFDLAEGSVREYASFLRGTTTWQFWWD